MKPGVLILGIHIPKQKIILVSGPVDVLEYVDIPSALERYLGRPRKNSYDHLTYLEYHSRYFLDDHPKHSILNRNVYNLIGFENLRKEPMVCILNSIYPKNQELFALRLLLRHIAARSWNELRMDNNELCATFYEAVRRIDLVANQDEEAVICLKDAIALRRPSSDTRFLLALMILYGASREPLESRFSVQLVAKGDIMDSVHHKINRLLSCDIDTVVYIMMPEHLNMSAFFSEKVRPSIKNQELFHMLLG
jgi:hypothetical protein